MGGEELPTASAGSPFKECVYTGKTQALVGMEEMILMTVSGESC